MLRAEGRCVCAPDPGVIGFPVLILAHAKASNEEPDGHLKYFIVEVKTDN